MRLRLLLIDGGMPTPQTQIPVNEGWRTVGVLDMGWARYRVAAEYDGDHHHRTDRRRYAENSGGYASSKHLAGWSSG